MEEKNLMAAKKPARSKKAPEKTGQAEPKGGKRAPEPLPEDLIETVLEEDDVDDAPPPSKKGK